MPSTRWRRRRNSVAFVLIVGFILAPGREAHGFTCDGGRALPDDRINDDYCDCHDRTDEPRTNACALFVEGAVTSFKCVNTQGYEPFEVPAHVVGDGICDCCDGSDEHAAALVQCPDDCERMAAEARARAAELEREMQQGRERFQGYADTGTRDYDLQLSEMHEAEIQLETLKEEIAGLESRKHMLQEAEQQEREKREQASDEALSNALHHFPLTIDETQHLLLSLAIHGNDTGFENMLGQLTEHLPNEISDSIDDAEVFALAMEASELTFVKGEKDSEASVAPGGEVKDASQGASARTMAEVLADLRQAISLNGAPVESLQAIIIQLAKDLNLRKRMVELIWEMKNTVAAAPVSDVEKDLGASYRLPELEDVERELRDKSAKKKSVSETVKRANMLEKTDFGQSKEYFPLSSQCFTKTASNFQYRICPFESAKQDHTSLGSFAGWVEPNVMHFTDGAKCWNGPKRSLKVHFSCGVSDEIVSVDEPDTCTYAAEFKSPAACGDY